METINSLDNINSKLATLIANNEYTSIGYVPILNSITACDIITIKNAKKLLDVIVIQNISNQNFDEFTIKTLTQLEPNLIVDYIKEASIEHFHLSLSSQKINSLNLMKGLLAFLPSSVFINEENFEIFKAVQVISTTFKDLFSLHNISTPESLKNFAELEAIKILQKLEKSKQDISKMSVEKALYIFEITAYQEFKINNKLYINLQIKEDQQTFNISYCFSSL